MDEPNRGLGIQLALCLVSALMPRRYPTSGLRCCARTSRCSAFSANPASYCGMTLPIPASPQHSLVK